MGLAVWVLLGLLAPGPLCGSPPRLEVREAGGQILLLCGAQGPRLRWVWSPRYPKCAIDPGDLLEIAQLPPGPEPPPAQFRGRLDPQSSSLGALLLRDLVMSDSGTFTCHGESGAEPPIWLEVTGGCRNNLTVSSNRTSPSALTLHCQRCPLLAGSASFRWFLNSQPLGNRGWATKSQLGATVRLDPSRRRGWGRWECHLHGTSSGGFEFCLEPPLEAGGAGPSSECWMWVTAPMAVLGLIGAGLGAWHLWRWRRRRGSNQRNQNKRENETGPRHPALC